MATENRGPEFQAFVIGFYVLAFLAVSLRCYVRVYISKAFGPDDWLMLAAMVFFSVHSTWALLGVHYGTGRHFADLTEQQIEKAMMYWWLSEIGFSLTIATSKLSIGVFLLRLTISRVHAIIIYINLAFTTISGLTFLFVCIFQCSPVSFFWYRAQGGTCIAFDVIITIVYVMSAINVISDFTFAILPIFVVWQLNMSKRIKWLLVPVFSMACLASTAVIVRIAYLQQFNDPDYLWATLDVANWSTVEMGLAITAGSLITLRPLLRLLPRSLGFHSANKNNSHSKYSTKQSQRRGQMRTGMSRLGDNNKDKFDMLAYGDYETNVWTIKQHGAEEEYRPSTSSNTVINVKVTTETEVTVKDAPADEIPQ